MPPSHATKPIPFQRLSAEWKTGLTLLVIISASLVPFDRWPILGLLMVIVFAGLSFAEVSIGYLVRRLGLFLPMLLVFGLSLPLTQRNGHQAWDWMTAFWLRCTVSFLAGLWFIHVLPFPELLAALIRWRCPQVLVAMLAFMYRYLFILWEELARLRRARDSRDFCVGSWSSRWTMNAQMIGLLLLRAMERAERTHHAMLARGWDGSTRFMGESPRHPS